MLFKKGFFIVSGILLLGGFVFAAHPLVTDDAGIVEKGKCEIEINYDIIDSKDQNENKIKYKNIGINIKHGITDNMDFGINLPYQVAPDTFTKAGNASMVLKFSLVEDFLALSFINELGFFDYFVNLIFSKEILNLSLNFNAGYFKSEDFYSGGNGIYNFSVAYPLIDKLNLVGEINSNDYGFEKWLVGWQYAISNYFTLSAAFSREENGYESYVLGLHKEF